MATGLVSACVHVNPKDKVTDMSVRLVAYPLTDLRQLARLC